MLSLLSAELLDQCGLTEPEDPMMVVAVTIEEGGKDPLVFLTPTDGVSSSFAALIMGHIKENPAPKRPGRYVWKIRQYGELETHADDPAAARFLFSLFRRDLGPAFDAMEEMVKALPTRGELQTSVDHGVNNMLRLMLEDGKVIDLRELRLTTTCSDCAGTGLMIREMGLAEPLQEFLWTAIDKANELGLPHPERLVKGVRKLTEAPAPKPNEFFMGTAVRHNHPYYDLCVQLTNEAGNALLRERAPIVADEFLQKVRNFSADLGALI